MCVYTNNDLKIRSHELEKEWKVWKKLERGGKNDLNIVPIYEIMKIGMKTEINKGPVSSKKSEWASNCFESFWK